MKKLLVLLPVLLLSACTKVEHDNMLITFVEQEKDVEPYTTRMIVTNDFLRIDDGEDSNNFVLLDRNKRVIYSVNPGEGTVMAVHEKKTEQKLIPPFKLKNAVKVFKDMKDAPEIEGQRPVHYQLITNNETCYDVVAVKGMLPGAVSALIELREILATDSAMTFNNIPADLHNACDMAQSTFAPARHLQFGFPIREWGKREYVRTLVDYKVNQEISDSLFELPTDFRHYKIDDLRKGKVNLGGAH